MKSLRTEKYSGSYDNANRISSLFLLTVCALLKMKDLSLSAVTQAVNSVLSKKTSKTLRKSIEADVQLKNSLKEERNRQKLLRAHKRVLDKEADTQQRKTSFETYLIMKNSELCSSNPNCSIGKLSD